jgi:hypothetical protein
VLRELTDEDWIAVVHENKGTITATTENCYFAFNFFADDEEYFGTRVYPDKVSAAREYCIDKDLLLQVALRRLNDAKPH